VFFSLARVKGWASPLSWAHSSFIGCVFSIEAESFTSPRCGYLLGVDLRLGSLLVIILRAACSLFAGRVSLFQELRVPHWCCVEWQGGDYYWLTSIRWFSVAGWEAYDRVGAARTIPIRRQCNVYMRLPLLSARVGSLDIFSWLCVIWGSKFHTTVTLFVFERYFCFISYCNWFSLITK
jgi:hypothetical protein